MRSLIILIGMLFSLSAWGQTAPMPTHHPVQEMEQRLKEEQAAKEALEKELTALREDISGGKKTMLELAEDIKANEGELTAIEKRLEKLQEEKQEIQDRLGVDRESMAELILALQRIRRVPPEALLARPDAPLQTAQSAMLLQSILPDIYGRAEHLKDDLERLEKIVTQAEQEKKALQIKTAALSLRQAEMSTLLDVRQANIRKTQGDLVSREAEIKQISARASGLRDLIEKLDEKRTQRETARATPLVRTLPKTDIIPKAGSGQLPVSGILRVRYGERDDIGAKAEGLRIEARNGALVVAPLGGIIRYTGDFRNYGQMVIIEHTDNYHSLVAGLARIDTVVGQSVVAGEPLGILGADNGDRPVLYYELRLNGQPVNPARKIGDLE